MRPGMLGRGVIIAFAFGCAALSLQCESKDARSLSTPFVELEAPRDSRNTHIPRVTYEPIICLELVNPATKKSMKCFGYLDTGADQCFITKELADRLGLKPDGQPPHEMQTGSGTISLDSTVVEYALNDPDGEAVKGFPTQSAPFFIQEGWLPADVVLGSIGFLDRFKEVRISYPKQITLLW